MKKRQTLGAVLIILSLGFIFHHKYINEFPSHTHAWTQSDRYALALGFVNNDLNFFKPETFSLLKNNQDPADWKSPAKESITAVDFPLHDYIPALLMKITGNSSPWLFRIYILLYGFAGLLFLYKLSYLWTENFYKSIFIIIFAATSPVYVYYQGGFLPTIPSLSNALIGIYFYSKYLFSQKNRQFNLALLFLTIAALSRTTFAIPLLAVFGLELARILKKDTKLKPKLIPVAISALSILLYFLYNNFLREKYGAIFLNFILPPSSFQQALEIIKMAMGQWCTQYFSTMHYIAITLLFLSGFYMLISKKKSLPKQTHLFGLLIIVLFVGSIAFSILMLRQFVAHDYYFLDTFYLPTILLLVVALSCIPIEKSVLNSRLSIIAILIFCIPVVIVAAKSQENRRIAEHWDSTEATINNFRNSESFLDSIGIPSNSKILVLGSYSSNIPFILMNRKGYPVISTKRENIQESLEWDYDYIVFQNEFFLSDIYSVYPEIISKVSKIADNGKISICIHPESQNDQSLIGFLGLEDKTPAYESVMTFDTLADNYWENTQFRTGRSYSGDSAGILDREMTYGLTYKTRELKAITEGHRTLLFSSYFLRDSAINCELVVSISENGANSYYKAYNLEEFIEAQESWERVDLIFYLPPIKSEAYEFALYLLNTHRDKLLIDDFGFRLY